MAVMRSDRAYFVLVSFNDDGSASMDGRYLMHRNEAVRCTADHNRRMTVSGDSTFAVLSTDLIETRKHLDTLFPRLT